MIMFQRPSFGAPVAIAYITGGALLGVWSGVWWYYLRHNPPETDAPYYFCTGFVLSALVLIIIGLTLGPIGRYAQQAEHATHEVVPTTPEELNAMATPVSPPVSSTVISDQGVNSQDVGPVRARANMTQGTSTGATSIPPG
jgi:hypothetical protein